MLVIVLLLHNKKNLNLSNAQKPFLLLFSFLSLSRKIERIHVSQKLIKNNTWILFFGQHWQKEFSIYFFLNMYFKNIWNSNICILIVKHFKWFTQKIYTENIKIEWENYQVWSPKNMTWKTASNDRTCCVNIKKKRNRMKNYKRRWCDKRKYRGKKNVIT